MTMTVLVPSDVPSDEGRAALADLDNVSLVVYDPDEAMPDEAVDAEVLVVPPRRAGQLLSAMRDMPKLRLVQTLRAGIDRWEGKLPNDETHHLVDAEFLARMPDRAVLVNAARGPVVDTGALLGELSRKRLRAALDVTDPEPLPPGHPLWDAPGVLITPHVGGNTTGAMDRAWKVVARQVAAYVAGQDPPNAGPALSWPH